MHSCNPRLFSRRLGLVSLALVSVVAVASIAIPGAEAGASSGWSISTSANTNTQDSNLLTATTCTNSWNCWAVGGSIPDLSGQNSQPAAMIQHWNGSAWSVTRVGGPTGSLASLFWDVTCVSGANCWAVGGAQTSASETGPEILAEHWNGVSWSTVPTPSVLGYLFSVTCSGSADCWAAGESVKDGNSGPLRGILYHWNGASWSSAATPDTGQAFDAINSVTCADVTDCWAVGYAGPNQGQFNFLPGFIPNVPGDRSLAEHWNGTTWSVVPTPQAPSPQGSYLSSITCTSASLCWAVGSTMDVNGNPLHTVVDRWNGSSWTTTPSPDAAASNLLTNVRCLSATACWATGVQGIQSGQNSGTMPDPFIESWNGTSWSIEPSPNVTVFGYLTGLSCIAGSGCFATGFAATNVNDNFTLQTQVEQLQLPSQSNQGVLMVGADGGIFTFGNATYTGSTGGQHLNAPIVGMADTPDGRGYWLVASDGGVFSFGDADYYGSTGGMHLNAPIVGMADTPDGRGYWLVASDGGVFSFGDAAYYGSTGGMQLNAPIVGMASNADGTGYWLVASDGGVFSFGSAAFAGSTGGQHLNAPIVGMAATPDGQGYWMVASDGGIFSFGDAGYFGSVPGQGIVQHPTIVGIAPSPDGRGYWLVDRNGGQYAYGDAAFLGSLSGETLSAPIAGVAATP